MKKATGELKTIGTTRGSIKVTSKYDLSADLKVDQLIGAKTRFKEIASKVILRQRRLLDVVGISDRIEFERQREFIEFVEFDNFFLLEFNPNSKRCLYSFSKLGLISNLGCPSYCADNFANSFFKLNLGLFSILKSSSSSEYTTFNI